MAASLRSEAEVSRLVAENEKLVDYMVNRYLKRYFVGSIIVFTAASFFCGASHTLALLIFWRIVQGIGGGALMTVSQAVLFEAFPPEEAGMAMALFGVGVMVGPTIGPTLGGWLTDNYGWPWIFYINIPVGIFAAVMIAAYVHDRADQKRPGRIDYIGIALLAASVGAEQELPGTRRQESVRR